MKVTEEIKKLRELDEKGLKAELTDASKKLANDLLRVQAGKLDNYSVISKQRRSIARINSIISEKSAE